MKKLWIGLVLLLSSIMILSPAFSAQSNTCDFSQDVCVYVQGDTTIPGSMIWPVLIGGELNGSALGTFVHEINVNKYWVISESGTSLSNLHIFVKNPKEPDQIICEVTIIGPTTPKIVHLLVSKEYQCKQE